MTGGLISLRDGERELSLTPGEALKLSEELRTNAYNAVGLPSLGRDIELREAKLRLKRLERKLQARSDKLGAARRRIRITQAKIDAFASWGQSRGLGA